MHVQIGRAPSLNFCWITLFVWYITVFVFSANAQVRLHLTTPGGAPCTRVGVGALCVLKVVCEGQGQTAFPTVAQLDGFRLQGRSKNMSIVNGVYATTYLYQLRAMQPGEYSIGPVYVVVDGASQISNTLSLTVIEQQEAERERSAVEKAPLALLRVHSDDTTSVAGQTIQGNLRLYCRADQRNIALDELGAPQWPELGIRIEDNEPTKSQEKVDGVDYTVLEWRWQMTSEKAGTLIIPPCAACLRIPSSAHDQDTFSGLYAGFIGGFKQQRLYSNSLRITVEELPVCNHPVHALGSFTGIHASISPAVIRKDEAMILHITLTGKGQVKEFSLQDMPEELRWYDSKKTVNFNENTKEATHSFEYVIQGLQEGNWQIPAQIFYYFDTRSYTYKKFKTESFFVTVTPTKNSSLKPTLRDDTQAAVSPSREEKVVESLSSDTVLHVGACKPVDERVMPVYIMLAFMLLPFVLCILLYSWRQRAFLLGQHGRVGKWRAFKQARNALKKSWYTGGSTADVYPIFLELFALCLCVPACQIDQDIVQHALRAAGMSDVQQQEWNVFFVRMMSMTYARATIRDESFFKQALQWLDGLYPYL